MESQAKLFAGNNDIRVYAVSLQNGLSRRYTFALILLFRKLVNVDRCRIISGKMNSGTFLKFSMEWEILMMTVPRNVTDTTIAVE